MKYLSKLILVFIFGILSLFVPTPAIAWIRTYGETDWHDMGRSVQQTTDGGYIVAGWTGYIWGADHDVYLIKTDSLGDTLWTKVYGGDENDYGESVQQTLDGGYIIAGTTYSYGAGRSNVYLIKTDGSGDTLWTKVYGGIDGASGWSVQQTTDGGYIVAGYTFFQAEPYCDVYLIKTNSKGDTLWTRTYGGADTTDLEYGYSVQETTDGGYIIAGHIDSLGHADIYLIKTDSLGDSLWARTYGGASSEQGYSVQQTTDGGYIVAGYTGSYGAGKSDVYLIKTDSIGDTLWTKTYGGTDWDYGYEIQQTTDGGYIVVGETDSDSALAVDVYLIKTGSSGYPLWTRIYGDVNSEFGRSVQQTTDGGYIVAGWGRPYGSVSYDVYLIKVNPEGSGIEEEITYDSFPLSITDPNPFTTKTTLKYKLTKAANVNISIYNLLGQEVKKLSSGKQSSGTHSVTWDGSGNSGKLPTGIYFLKIKAGDKEASVKLTFIR